MHPMTANYGLQVLPARTSQMACRQSAASSASLPKSRRQRYVRALSSQSHRSSPELSVFPVAGEEDPQANWLITTALT
jgi:hypothetical protein